MRHTGIASGRLAIAAAVLLVLLLSLGASWWLVGESPRRWVPGLNRDGLWRQALACAAESVPRPPCVTVRAADDYVIIKDHSPRKPRGWLIVPISQVTGIEDKRALAPPVSEFWRFAWAAAQPLVDRPPEDIGLAINSAAGRTQDELHIHISCVRRSVRLALAAATGIGDAWAPAPFLDLDGRLYNARRTATLDTSPFRLLADLPGARNHMQDQSLAVIGTAGGGFVLLQDQTGPSHRAVAERLLDQHCAS